MNLKLAENSTHHVLINIIISIGWISIGLNFDEKLNFEISSVLTNVRNCNEDCFSTEILYERKHKNHLRMSPMNNLIEIDCLHNIFYVHYRSHWTMQIVTRFYWNILSNDGNIIFIKGARLACSLLHGPTYNFHGTIRRVKDNYFDFIML